jgi:hypothetical protein
LSIDPNCSLIDSTARAREFPALWRHPPRKPRREFGRVAASASASSQSMLGASPASGSGAVTAIAGSHITAVVDQDLLGSLQHGLFDKDPVSVTPSHVFGILDQRGTPIWEATSLPNCIGHRHISRESNA